MPSDNNDHLDEPYETWAQHEQPAWPRIKRRIQMAGYGAVWGSLLGAAVIGMVMLIDPTRRLEPIVGMALFSATGAYSALIQHWKA